MIAGRTLLAQATGTFTTTELDVPESLPVILGCAVGLVALFAFVIATYRRDAAQLSRFWRWWMTSLRVAAIAAIVVLMLNPHERTQRSALRPSEVAIAIDTSVSMQFPAGDGSDASAAAPSRASAVRGSLLESEVLKRLNQRHTVTVYTFDAALEGPHRSIPKGTLAASPIPPETWESLVQPRGLETRLGESVQELIGRVAGPTLSGVVIVSDGSANAGLDASVANQKARSTQTRLVTVGVGSRQRPTNIAIASLQAPTEVHIGDPFRITTFVQGQGAAGKTVEVELLARAEGSDSDPASIAVKTVELTEDGVPAEVSFEQKPGSPGGIDYEVRVRAQGAFTELSDADNSRRRTINVSERQIRVLLMAGGPSRDYRFVRDMLHRHTGMELDVWLQTVDKAQASAVTQDASKVLTEFPDSREVLFEYDAVLAFDADWNRVTAEQLDLLREWVADRAGGVVLVAGPIHTGAVVTRPELQSLRDLLPVRLSPFLLDLEIGRRNTQAWPIELTEEGEDSAFFQLADATAAGPDVWKQFSGVHRSYPTAGVKDGATALALYTNPRAQTENGKPIIAANHFYGSGRCLFLGTGEFWRMRSVSPEYFNRFWTKAIRDVAQGRIKRGNSRGLLMMDRTEFVLGQSVRIRTQLYDASLQPLEAESVPVTIIDPFGKPLLPERRLLRDRNRPGQFVGSFRAGLQGTWNIQLPIPESRDTLNQKIEVLLPNLEADRPAQNVGLLEELAQDTGGRYIALTDAETQLADLLPDRSELVMIDERLRPLWDRQWVLFLLVGLFGIEWLTRKLLKLA